MALVALEPGSAAIVAARLDTRQAEGDGDAVVVWARVHALRGSAAEGATDSDDGGSGEQPAEQLVDDILEIRERRRAQALFKKTRREESKHRDSSVT